MAVSTIATQEAIGGALITEPPVVLTARASNAAAQAEAASVVVSTMAAYEAIREAAIVEILAESMVGTRCGAVQAGSAATRRLRRRWW